RRVPVLQVVVPVRAPVPLFVDLVERETAEMPCQADQVFVERAVEQAKLLFLGADRWVVETNQIEVTLQKLVSVVAAHVNLGGFVTMKRRQKQPSEYIGGEDQHPESIKKGLRTKD